jgi:uncharacterized membrane protein
MPGEAYPFSTEASPGSSSTPDNDNPAADAVWTFRGYRLRASEFTTAMVHLFRAEVQRANVWRQRLDATTNWAVISTGAAISIGFSQSGGAHFVILMNMLLVTMFLWIEARRYRYYELWSYRVRLMETDFFAAMLVPPFHPSPDWAESLAEHLLHPHFPISTLEAVGRRLRRNYLWIYGGLTASWMMMLWLQPQIASSFQDLSQRAAIGPIPGPVVMTITLLFFAILVLISLGTIGLQDASGEVLPRYGQQPEIPGLGDQKHKPRAGAWFRPAHRRPQLLTLLITDHAEPVSRRILEDMHRGVTALNGTGMFTGQAHSVLVCAITVTEVNQLKILVADVDPKAFVIVSPAQEVFGRGFMPLHEQDNESLKTKKEQKHL